MAEVRFNGTPGDRWRNETGKVQYQFHVTWVRSCGLCIGNDGAIGNWWPIPLHDNCRCYQTPIYPGGTSSPFVDFRAKIEELTDEQKTRVVGLSNWRLIDAGIVKWSDVVQSGRILSLAEVIAMSGVSIRRMIKAGVSRAIAENAWARAHSGTIDARQEMIDRLRAQYQRRGPQRHPPSRSILAIDPTAPPGNSPLNPLALGLFLGLRLVLPPVPPDDMDDEEKKLWSEVYERVMAEGRTVKESKELADQAVRRRRNP